MKAKELIIIGLAGVMIFTGADHPVLVLKVL